MVTRHSSNAINICGMHKKSPASICMCTPVVAITCSTSLSWDRVAMCKLYMSEAIIKILDFENLFQIIHRYFL